MCIRDRGLGRALIVHELPRLFRVQTQCVEKIRHCLGQLPCRPGKVPAPITAAGDPGTGMGLIIGPGGLHIHLQAIEAEDKFLHISLHIVYPVSYTHLAASRRNNALPYPFPRCSGRTYRSSKYSPCLLYTSRCV